ncbi:hypothetical protein GCM10011317_22080 [Niveispirillum cyanobacteriorum]|nr:hypothetical protein GCM10011317_22080 [Niveispirillum cyanobacteriorum]
MIMGNCRTKAADWAARIVSSSWIRYQGLNTGVFRAQEKWKHDRNPADAGIARRRHWWMAFHTA